MQTLSPLSESGVDSFFPRKKQADDTEFDITPMIDLVFMMNIYFLVTALGGALAEVDLPTANHVSALDAESAVVVTVVSGIDGRSIKVYLGDGVEGPAILDAAEQDERIAEYIEQAHDSGKRAVLIKAEQRVLLREIGRMCGAAALEGMTLHVAVSEKDTAP